MFWYISAYEYIARLVPHEYTGTGTRHWRAYNILLEILARNGRYTAYNMVKLDAG